MNSQDKIELCEKLNAEVHKFAEKWMENPLLWGQEIDVQCALVNAAENVVAAFYGQKQKRPGMRAAHSNFGPVENVYEFARLTCEPYVSLDRGYAKPDIVVWDDLPSDEKPEHNFINSGFWKMLWACEIKYTDNRPANEEDKQRLRELVDNGLLAQGCSLSLVLVHKESDEPNRGPHKDIQPGVVEIRAAAWLPNPCS